MSVKATSTGSENVSAGVEKSGFAGRSGLTSPRNYRACGVRRKKTMKKPRRIIFDPRYE